MELNTAYENYCNKYKNITQELWNEIEEINRLNIEKITTSQDTIKKLEDLLKERDESLKIAKIRQNKLKEELENLGKVSNAKFKQATKGKS